MPSSNHSLSVSSFRDSLPVYSASHSPHTQLGSFGIPDRQILPDFALIYDGNYVPIPTGFREDGAVDDEGLRMYEYVPATPDCRQEYDLIYMLGYCRLPGEFQETIQRLRASRHHLVPRAALPRPRHGVHGGPLRAADGARAGRQGPAVPGRPAHARVHAEQVAPARAALVAGPAALRPAALSVRGRLVGARRVGGAVLAALRRGQAARRVGRVQEGRAVDGADGVRGEYAGGPAAGAGLEGRDWAREWKRERERECEWGRRRAAEPTAGSGPSAAAAAAGSDGHGYCFWQSGRGICRRVGKEAERREPVCGSGC
ncbi:uncharacterized protein E0L32_001282 [Thyridium curvatum]|uniref:Uncharacterized protein n=1 Tax=Thyridium curvatum TaxID=1093900 RepID=A0A507AIQ4_9PEZI|nr:uncharacterized protein E0L32_001282 [Thyridium curvatum]TPX10085.1 hypothetical protein E0L32_001282 [Thyridium curvatum]